MKILFYGINFYPELTGIGKYSYEMCKWLAKQGHSVDVITAMPYYPKWKVFKEYRGRLWFKEELDGIKVHRCPLYVPSKPSGIKRILNEVSFFFNSLVWWFRAFFRKYDIVVSVCPPLIIGIMPFIYSKIKKVPWLFHIQDLQVDMARELGLIKNNFVLNLAEGLEKISFKNASILSTISDGMKEKIQKKVDRDIYILPNWVDTGFIKDVGRDNSIRREMGFSMQDKIILYAGNIGKKQGLDLLIEAVEPILRGQSNLYLVFVGSGAGREDLERLVGNMNLENVKFFDLVPFEKLPELLSMADLHLVLQKKEASDLVMPSKLTGILAVGGCAIVTAPKGSFLHTIVKRHNMGILVEPEDKDALYSVIKNALEMNLQEYKKNARNFAEKYLSMDVILSNFEKFLLNHYSV